MWHNHQTFADGEKLAGQVAEYLDGYAVEIRKWDSGVVDIRLVKGGIFQISLSQAYGDTSRLVISGILPDNPHRDYYDLDGGRITVSVTRSPKAIAADIARRLLPAYEPTVETAILKIAEADKKREGLTAQVKDLAARVPGAKVFGDGSDRMGIDFPYRPSGAYFRGRVEVSSGGSADIDISIENAAFLRDLADLVAKHQG